ncbi:hypothetical protein GCM10010869_22590 [Mesorhizobium tianshanense]|uniref:Uncharacterized protein DUF3179 n=1 Tax=Mesorhizobium tianshanense TaxID=39844 RepID=A0A562P2Q7_9HYPH|nr:DUF3179 domain-containing protein [Mesorhizobium tianshanense]TWI38734.1 uncharacterized protein DUF3179 [Mesorhizobium tianshanense]GLS36668.1 hypothetical protein GCM10010869_22590 [Mesorhizobium tianshanense]
MTDLRNLVIGFLAALLLVPAARADDDIAQQWKREWPRTDFSRTTVDLSEIISGGPPKDGIPSIDDPKFIPVAEVDVLAPQEPVLSIVLAADARAYPLRVMMWHEIVNDVVAGTPVTVTYCPLCNTGIVFDRRLDGRTLDFGTTGKLRHSDLVMYDRQTETWWQQFGGEAIVGELAGRTLRMLPSRLESWESFRKRAPEGRVLVPNDPDSRAYGSNPYVGYDQAARPFLFSGALPENVPAMMRVVVVGKEAWTLPLVRTKGIIGAGDLSIGWRPGQVSALDTANITRGAEVGNITVQRNGEDVQHTVTFAFAFFAFEPDGVLHTEEGLVRQ